MKIVEKSLRHRGRTKRKMETQVVTSAQGKRLQAPRLNADSASFDDDLLQSFTRNVNRARRENKAQLGRRDGPLNDGD